MNESRVKAIIRADMETIKEKMGIKLWCDGKFMTVNLMLDEELIDTHTVRLDGNVCFYQ